MPFIKDRFIPVGEVSTRKLSVRPVIPDCTAASESGNTISVVIQCMDPDGLPVSRVVDLLVEVLKSDAKLATSSEFTLAETGAGAAVSTTAKPSLIVTTSAAGLCTIAVHDVVGSYTGPAYLIVTPLNTLGSPGVFAVTFS